MSIYSRDDERAIRVQRLVEDWTTSGLLAAEQRDRILPELKVDFRRTNKFLRATLFLFGLLIVNAAAGLMVVLPSWDPTTFRWLALLAAAVCFAAAQKLIARYRLYHFGVEEALALSSAAFFVVFAATVFSTLSAFTAATLAAAVLFVRFGYVYAGVAATLLAPMIVFDLDQSDTFRRLIAFALLLTIHFIARERREDHDWNYPADAYAAIEAVSWAALYLVANLKVSSWLSLPDDVPQFYWGTYAVIWMVPIAGLWIAIRDRHRLLLDVNIVLAIVTILSNKPYLGAEPNPWDPIVFGVLLIGIAVGLRRWLAAGADGSRRGFTAERVLASEKELVAWAGGVTVVMPGPPAAHPHDSPSIGGGGRSGGAGASGEF